MLSPRGADARNAMATLGLRVSSGERSGDGVNGGRAAYNVADAGLGQNCNLDDEERKEMPSSEGFQKTGVRLCGGHSRSATARASLDTDTPPSANPWGRTTGCGEVLCPRGLRSRGVTKCTSCVPAGTSSAWRGCTYLHVPQRVLDQWRLVGLTSSEVWISPYTNRTMEIWWGNGGNTNQK